MLARTVPALALAALVSSLASAQTQVDLRRAGGVTTSSATVLTGDNKTSPTAAPVACYDMQYDGATWDRVQYQGIEDVAETAATGLAMCGTVRRDVLVSSAGATGDNATVNTSSIGGLWTEEATRAVAYGSSPTAIAAGVYGKPIADLEGRPYINAGHPRAIHCYVATTGTAATQVTGCEVVASNSIYVTSVTVSGDILNATATPWKITSGTSTDCTGATVVLSGWHPALSSHTMTFPSPIKVTVAHGLCILDATVGSKSAMITGYIAP